MGRGWIVETISGALRAGHSGGNIGSRGLLRFWLEFGLGAAVMTNADDSTYADVANAELRFECADNGAAGMLILRQPG